MTLVMKAIIADSTAVVASSIPLMRAHVVKQSTTRQYHRRTRSGDQILACLFMLELEPNPKVMNAELEANIFLSHLRPTTR